MAQIIQRADYIQKQKKKYLGHTVGALSVMLILFMAGIWVTGTRNNLFTLAAVLFTLVVAQAGTRFFTLYKYQDGNQSTAEKIQKLPEQYVIWNSALITDGREIALFEHMIIGENQLVCILYPGKSYEKDIRIMNRLLERKGFADCAMYVRMTDLDQWLEKSMEKDFRSTSWQIEIVQEMKPHAI